jgi:predicted AAA+ superfamily ATPase
MYSRLIKFSNNNSFFLFGARGTGKSFLLKHRFSEENSVFIDLLDPETYLDYSLNPSNIINYIDKLNKNIEWIIIDEVQKIPKLLDVVHKYLSEGSKKFILTGSSARKLKRGSANMLAGRAFINNLYPLTSTELGKDFNLTDVLKWGSLPGIFAFKEESDKMDFLRSYVHTYITQEITEEQVVRKLDPFRKFLNVSAQMNGKVINFSKIAREVGTSSVNVSSYFQILEDTLLGLLIEPFHTSVRKSIVGSPKFYFFDTGVIRTLNNALTLDVLPQTYNFGELFESFIINEIFRLQSYYKKDYRLNYLRTKSGVEVDLVVTRPGKKTLLLEIKSTTNVTEEQVKPLIGISADIPDSEAYCISLDKTPKKFQNVNCLHWEEALALFFE